jgi:hypothetical protein
MKSNKLKKTIVKFTVTEPQQREIRVAAAEANMTMAQFVRKLVLKFTGKAPSKGGTDA